VLDSGFTGPFGVLGHVSGDFEEILRGNFRSGLHAEVSPAPL
jgi:hypothetical protein